MSSIPTVGWLVGAGEWVVVGGQVCRYVDTSDGDEDHEALSLRVSVLADAIDECGLSLEESLIFPWTNYILNITILNQVQVYKKCP